MDFLYLTLSFSFEYYLLALWATDPGPEKKKQTNKYQHDYVCMYENIILIIFTRIY